MSFYSKIYKNSISLAKEITAVSLLLFKIMIPVIIIVKILEEVGAIPWLSLVFEPIMTLVGLPESMGLVWTTTMLTNIYAGLVIFFQTAFQESLSIAQVTILGTMMLIAHSLPIEVSILHKAGIRFWFALLLRIGGAIIAGILLDFAFSNANMLQQPVQLIWNQQQTNQSLTEWFFMQLKSLVVIVLVISVLLTGLRILRWLRIEQFMLWILQPILRLLGIAPQAASLTIIGITLGLSFGGGLLIKEAQSGNIQTKDCFAAFCLLSLCHSIIEDTLLALSMGADLLGILWFRLAFSLVVISCITLMWKLTTTKFQQNYLVYAKAETSDKNKRQA